MPHAGMPQTLCAGDQLGAQKWPRRLELPNVGAVILTVLFFQRCWQDVYENACRLHSLEEQGSSPDCSRGMAPSSANLSLREATNSSVVQAGLRPHHSACANKPKGPSSTCISHLWVTSISVLCWPMDRSYDHVHLHKQGLGAEGGGGPGKVSAWHAGHVHARILLPT